MECENIRKNQWSVVDSCARLWCALLYYAFEIGELTIWLISEIWIFVRFFGQIWHLNELMHWENTRTSITVHFDTKFGMFHNFDTTQSRRYYVSDQIEYISSRFKVLKSINSVESTFCFMFSHPNALKNFFSNLRVILHNKLVLLFQNFFSFKT